MQPSFYRVRLLEDTRHGRQGETVFLPHEYAEALLSSGRAVMLSDKSMTNRAKTLKTIGGTESRKGH